MPGIFWKGSKDFWNIKDIVIKWRHAKLYLPAKNHSNLSLYIYLNKNLWCSEQLWRTCLQAFQNVRELFTTSNKTISHDLCISLHSLAAQNGLICELRVAERWKLKKPRISSGWSGSSFLRVYTWKSQEIQMTWEKMRTS